MRAVFCVQNDTLKFTAAEAGLHGQRPLADGDLGLFISWIATYRSLVGRDPLGKRLLVLGMELFNWLNDNGSWLGRLLGESPAPLIVEYQAIGPFSPLSDAFLAVPWELLASSGVHLASSPITRYAPARRVGASGVNPGATDHRLSLIFMAAAPTGMGRLDFEGEETALIRATGDLGLDLDVEESGELRLLAERLAQTRDIHVLHLSCHGTSVPEPILLLEDENGNGCPTSLPDLVGALAPNVPRLVFLSACQSSQSGEFTDGLVHSLVEAGIPAALGWDGSVLDREAIEFARVFYQAVSRRSSLEEAVEAARRALLAKGESLPSRDWHLPRLWLGRGGGGAIVGGSRKRKMRSPDHGHKEFLDRRNQRSEVASRSAFVGRRRELQTCLRILRAGDSAGLLIHGMGRMGKSSLAARIAHRRPDLTPVVLFGKYDSASLLEALKDACPEMTDQLDAAQRELPQAPGRLYPVLRALLEGPSQQIDSGRPLLVVIDDFERVLTSDASGIHSVDTAYVATIAQIVRAFATAQTDSRLIITSRYRFTLVDHDVDWADRLTPFHIPPMPAATARKLAIRRREISDMSPSEGELDARNVLLDRLVEVSSGNPGLESYLVDLVEASPNAGGEVLDQMRAYLAEGKTPDNEWGQAFFEGIALEKLLSFLSDSAREVLRAATLFELPVPLEVLSSLEKQAQSAIKLSLGLGLCDSFERRDDRDRPTAAVNALVRPRLAPLDPSEHRELAKRTLPLLYEAWGGSEEERTFPREVELTRLALLAVDGVVLNHTAARAVHWLKESFEYHKALDWAQNSIDVIEKCGLPISVQLLRQAGDVSNIIGEYSRAERYYDAVLRRVDAGELMHSTDLSATMISQGRVLRQMGRPMDALRCFSLAQEVSKATDDLKEYVVALGEAANSCAERGDLDAALVSHSECLSLHEKLGDSRGYAITLGEIARILTERGQFDEALALHERQVKVLVELDDRRSAAIASGDIAKLKRLSGDLQGALEIHESELQIYAALGDRRSHAVTLGDLAITLRDMGKEELALKLQHERLAENREIGDALGQAAALHDIAKIELSRSRPDQAFPLLAEAFGLADQVHAEPWVCAIGYLYAPLLAMRGKVKVALGILERVKAGGEHLRSPGIREDILAMISILKKVERSTRRR